MYQRELQVATTRLLSLDFFRGITMFFLIGTVYKVMQESDNNFISGIGWQFEHRYWHGLTLYDFIEPFFMFIAGVAIPFSAASRANKGDSWMKMLRHVLTRSVILFFLGIFIYSVDAGKPVFRLWNVLTQLSFAYLVAFLLMRTPIKLQIFISIVLLILTDLLYRFWPVEGFNQPYVSDHNFGSWFDIQTMGVLEGDHWVAFNFVPTTAFTIWGVVAGLILLRDIPYQKKLTILIVAGCIGIVTGFLLDPIIPMIKRIATASILIETGGWCLIVLALAYWIVDIRRIQKIPLFFAIVGMNSLFIYMFTQVGGSSFVTEIVKPIAYGLFFWSDDSVKEYTVALLTWFVLWYLCFWLYRHKIFIKI